MAAGRGIFLAESFPRLAVQPKEPTKEPEGQYDAACEGRDLSQHANGEIRVLCFVDTRIGAVLAGMGLQEVGSKDRVR